MIDLKNVYITSDLHLFHSNIIRYCSNTRGRWLPKIDVQNIFGHEKPDILSMNEYIFRQFDELPANSIIINNGDLFLNSKVKFNDIKLLVDRMKSNNKHLWIIMGNHDKEVRKYLKIDKPSRDIFLDLGFERVYEFPILLDNFILSHEPVYLSPNSNFKNIYGHTHDCNIDENYFNRDCENWAMMERVKKENITKQTNLDIDTSIKYNDKTINVNMYYNVCWDAHGKILELKDVLKELN